MTGTDGRRQSSQSHDTGHWDCLPLGRSVLEVQQQQVVHHRRQLGMSVRSEAKVQAAGWWPQAERSMVARGCLGCLMSIPADITRLIVP